LHLLRQGKSDSRRPLRHFLALQQLVSQPQLGAASQPQLGAGAAQQVGAGAAQQVGAASQPQLDSQHFGFLQQRFDFMWLASLVSKPSRQHFCLQLDSQPQLGAASQPQLGAGAAQQVGAGSDTMQHFGAQTGSQHLGLQHFGLQQLVVQQFVSQPQPFEPSIRSSRLLPKLWLQSPRPSTRVPIIILIFIDHVS
jgi:hypothetical protein